MSGWTVNINRAFIDDLLLRTDIVAVIGRYVTLIPSGNSYKGLCPFHEEKTPSFHVVPGKQFFHCFGCGVSGDVIHFLKQHENLSFYESVRELAQINGIALPTGSFQPVSDEETHRLQLRLSLLEQAATYYQSMLGHHQFAKKAQDYLHRRNITPDMAKAFMIGFAPPERNALHRLWQSNHEQVAVALELGLIKRNDHGEVYDQFRNRIIFPIRDTRGKIRGFGARSIDDSQQPKYLNSNESDIFHKSNQLYGMYESLQKRSQRDWLVTEGYIDVLALHKHGFDKAVACLGTAINSRQIQWLGRYRSNILFAFDGDDAGSKAAEKTMHLCLSMISDEREFRFVFFPAGEDPDTYLTHHGANALQALIDKESIPLSQMFIRWLLQQGDINSVEGKAKIAAISTKELAQVPQGYFRNLLNNQVAEMTQTRRGYSHRQSRQRRNHTPSVRQRQPEQVTDKRQLLYFLSAIIDNRDMFTQMKMVDQLKLIAEYVDTLPVSFFIALTEEQDKETTLIVIEHLDADLVTSLTEYQRNNHQHTSARDMYRLFVQLQKHCYQHMTQDQKSEYIYKRQKVSPDCHGISLDR